MTPEHPRSLFSRLPFWALQLIGWFGFLMVHFLTGMAHGQHSSYLSVSISSAIGGAIVTWPLHLLYQRIWPLPPRQLIAIAAPAFLAIVAAMSIIYAASIQNYCPDECRPASFLGYVAYSGFTAYVILSWSALWFGIRNGRALAVARERELAAQAQANLAQLKMLRYQLNPHFLFNTLNAIATLVLEGANDTAERMLGALSRFLRYTLDQEPQQKVPLQRELEVLDLYLRIEKMRFEERLIMDIQIDPQAERALVPGLILQPLIENAIKYAVATSEQPCRIGIGARINGEWLELELIDEGPGSPHFAPGAPEPNGVGLRNTRERLATVYGARQRMTVENRAEGGTRVRLTLPLELSP
ncbi:MAG: histidine kinase [Lysobacterales bacterium]|nr:histidine kinase [Xanthomonadales bacterium]MCB1613163.1 histidine kinase [Xanthomonadales bacterium]